MTLFRITNYPINALIEQIDLGEIGLPELQRPFVWPNVNVRNLFDSLYRGYPVGFFLFWESGADENTKNIGVTNRDRPPKLVIVDGQQRLTSLYAVIKGVEVLRSNFKKERIRIAFNPLSERFDVSDAAIMKDRSYIPDISVLWQTGADLFEIADNYVEGLKSVRELSEDDIRLARTSINRLLNIRDFQFVALTLMSSVSAETIAEVFVRINGQGKKLNQSDFIMTLMSVHWDDGRTDLENFARLSNLPADGQSSPFNYFIKPSPDQMLRVTIGLALKRARLESVYSALRGLDPKTGIDVAEKRDAQFYTMRISQSHALNLANWHHFLGALRLAGYRGEKMITSQTAIIYCYVLYLIGIVDFGIDKKTMRQAIAEYFFMTALTGRYTNSPETRFESDLSIIRDLKTPESFLTRLREVSETALTNDYWEITLPAQLATSAARSPSLFAYQAALVKLDAKVLFSPMPIAEMLDPAERGSKSKIEQHHLFPRGYLEDNQITNLKQINQIANFASLEWPDNISISKTSPSIYAPPLDAELSASEREKYYFWHALPSLWWEMPYEEFLQNRRVRMAAVIRAAWNHLANPTPEKEKKPLSVEEIISTGETESVEFKSTLRINLHTNLPDDKMQLSVLKTIAAFLNAQGGTLIIGVDDNGEILGLKNDNFPNEDKMGLHLVNLVKERLGEVFMPYVHPHFEDYENDRVLSVRCEKGPKPAYVKDNGQQRFFVRGGNATAELTGQSIIDYVNKRFT